MINLTTPAGVVDYMGLATSRLDWCERHVNVRIANDDRDPSFWHEMIVKPNLYDRTVGAQSQTESES